MVIGGCSFRIILYKNNLIKIKIMSTLNSYSKQEQLKRELTKKFGQPKLRKKSLLWIDKENGEKHIISLGPVYNIRNL